MTAGFSYDLNSPMLEKCRRETNGKCPTREAMKYLAKEPLLFEPGSSWIYGTSADVLGAVIGYVIFWLLHHMIQGFHRPDLRR